MTQLLPVLDEVRRVQDEMVARRRQIHAHPELGFEEHATSGLVASRLESWRYEVTRGVGRTGVVGRLKLGSGTRRLGLRADMDALPSAPGLLLAPAVGAADTARLRSGRSIKFLVRADGWRAQRA